MSDRARISGPPVGGAPGGGVRGSRARTSRARRRGLLRLAVLLVAVAALTVVVALIVTGQWWCRRSLSRSILSYRKASPVASGMIDLSAAAVVNTEWIQSEASHRLARWV